MGCLLQVVYHKFHYIRRRNLQDKADHREESEKEWFVIQTKMSRMTIVEYIRNLGGEGGSIEKNDRRISIYFEGIDVVFSIMAYD